MQRTNNNLQNTTQKTKDWVRQTTLSNAQLLRNGNQLH